MSFGTRATAIGMAALLGALLPVALAVPLGGAGAVPGTTGPEDGAPVYEWSDEEPGCSAHVRVQGDGVRITKAVVDADPVNCDIDVEYEFTPLGWISGESWGHTMCGEGSGRGWSNGITGRGRDTVFTSGCPQDPEESV